MAVRWQYLDLCAENLVVTDPSHAGLLSEALEALYAQHIVPDGVPTGFELYLECCSSTAAQLTAYALWCLGCTETIKSAGLANQAPMDAGAASYELVLEEAGTRLHERMFEIILATLEVTSHCYLPICIAMVTKPELHSIGIATAKQCLACKEAATTFKQAWLSASCPRALHTALQQPIPSCKCAFHIMARGDAAY